MTRKEELEARARDYVSLFVMSGAEPAATKNLTWMLKQVEREVWGQIVQQIDYRHCVVTMDQTTLKEWCMRKYKELA